MRLRLRPRHGPTQRCHGSFDPPTVYAAPVPAHIPVGPWTLYQDPTAASPNINGEAVELLYATPVGGTLHAGWLAGTSKSTVNDGGTLRMFGINLSPLSSRRRMM